MDDALPSNLCERWEHFFSEHFRQEDESDHIFADPVLMPLQRKREMEPMLCDALGSSFIMEIGADKGGSFYHWCRIIEQPLLENRVRKAVAIEVRGTPYADLFRRAFDTIEFLFLPQSSHDPATVQQVRDFLGADQFDCIFLDGEKCAFDKDFTAYSPMVRPGGRVFLHDIHGTEPPAQVFKNLSRQYRASSIIDESECAEAKGDTAYEQWLRYWSPSRPSCGVGVIEIP